MKTENLDDTSNIEILPMCVYDAPLKEDVIGDAANFIENFVEAVETEKIYKAMGTMPDKTFLITGPPGNGKTIAIEALVNEMNRDIPRLILDDQGESPKLNILGFKYDTGAYGTAYINKGCKIVQSFFNTCFTLAKHGQKTLIVFDEAETIFGKRLSHNSHKEDTKVLETIMKNMQDLHYTDNVYMVMMSNFPEAFDEASIRAGRVDKRYKFQNPSLEERALAYEHTIKKINKKANGRVIKSCDYESLSSLSGGFSYSDITEAVNSAIKTEIKEAYKKTNSTNIKIQVTEKQITESIKEHKEMFIKRKGPREIGFNTKTNSYKAKAKTYS